MWKNNNCTTNSVFRLSQSVKSGAGFTLMELIVVLAIMGILSSLIVANYARQRVPRDLRIAQNELITNLRKMQSYTLSARSLPNGQSVQYYLLRLSTATSSPVQYQLQAMYNTTSNPQLVQVVETYQMPAVVKIQSLKINRAVVPFTENPTCALVTSRLPFAVLTLTSGCTFSNFSGSSPMDHYSNVLDFRANVDNNPTSKDSKLIITLSDLGGTVTKKVLVNTISGIVCPTIDESTCSDY